MPLPRGRHSLSRDDVEASQRNRLELAVVSVVRHHGLADATVAQIVREASVSRQTFYELYESKQQCYETALRRFSDHVAEVAAAAFGAPGDPDAALERGLGLVLREFADAPDLTYCLLLERPRRVSVDATATSDLRRHFLTAVTRALEPVDPFIPRALGAMVRGLLEEELVAGRTGSLPRLAPAILTMVRCHRPSA